MKKTLVRLKVRREVVHTLTRRDLTIVAGGVIETKEAGGCTPPGNGVGPIDPQ